MIVSRVGKAFDEIPDTALGAITTPGHVPNVASDARPSQPRAAQGAATSVSHKGVAAY